ncbi:Hypothetical predicted protein [Mytilus galloprovincialis]|uniref:Uncharacterized protein n=1 Tax=Mytilus galloprovincialis TaxID=29158 RepID=A0A8B6FDJ4_MYTGA|nr:Hypothetical predicted protein [Mytilus galloprovincialis]
MSTYECSPCNFTTRRTYQYQRHLQSTRHAQLHFLTSHASPVSQDHSPTQSLSSPLIVQPPSSDNGSSNVSSPHLSGDPQQKKSYTKIEQIQRRAARYVTNKDKPTASVTEMIDHLKWKPLQQRRKETRLVMFYKIENNMVAIEKEGRLTPSVRKGKNIHPKAYQVPHSRIDAHKTSYLPQTIRDWNALPPDIPQAETLGIPIDMRQKQETIQFLGALEKADIMDVAKIIIDDIKSNRNGIETFDAANKKTCFVKGIVDCVVADFNMMSFCCNHLGATAQKYCPKCYADADHFMSLCQKRTPADTKLQLSRLNLRSLEKDKKKFRKKKDMNISKEKTGAHKMSSSDSGFADADLESCTSTLTIEKGKTCSNNQHLPASNNTPLKQTRLPHSECRTSDRLSTQEEDLNPIDKDNTTSDRSSGEYVDVRLDGEKTPPLPERKYLDHPTEQKDGHTKYDTNTPTKEQVKTDDGANKKSEIDNKEPENNSAITHPESDIRSMTMIELGNLLKSVKLNKFAEMCCEEQIDGDFFMEMNDEILLEEPFSLKKFDILKVKKLQGGWKPK